MERSLMRSYFKKILTLALLTISATISCAEKSIQIKYPEWLQELSQELSDKELQQLFFDTLITDPKKALLYNIRVKSTFKECITPAMNLKELNAFADEYEKKCPLFLMNECYGPECPFSRLRNPSCKEEFELHVVEKLCTLFDTKQKKPLHYVSFGSGDMLLDCFLLTKACHAQKMQKKQIAALAIHLIDLSFSHYVEYRQKHTHNSREIMTKITTESIGHEILRTATNSPEQKNQWMNCTYFYHERTYKQFLSFLEKHFKKVEFSLFIHKSTENYLDYLTEQKIPAADIIVAADIQEPTPKYLRNSPLASYKQLCTESKKLNPASAAILLGREGFESDEKIKIFYDGETPISRETMFL